MSEKKVPKGQTVEIGSIWDMRDVPDEEGTGFIGLFKVDKIINGDAYDDEKKLYMPVDMLASEYIKLTPYEAKLAAAELKEEHRSTIQPIKGPNGKVIQVGSTWDLPEFDENGNPTRDSKHIVVASLSDSAVFEGPSYSGFGTSTDEIFKHGREIPLEELPNYWSSRTTRLLNKEIEKNLDEGYAINVERVFHNGRLIEFEISDKEKSSHPTVTFHDRLADEKEAKEAEQIYQNFLEWVAQERALAAEHPLNVIRKNRISMPLMQKASAIVQPINALMKHTIAKEVQPAKKKAQLTPRERLRA